jgi:dihydroorotate dehydrogenase electron transfer subunit
MIDVGGDRGKPVQSKATVVENRLVARDTYRLRLRQPEIAQAILPGQFVMVRAAGRLNPLLARPFALYDTVDGPAGDAEMIDLVYLVMGNGTRTLRTLVPEDMVDVWGPLGNTFPTQLDGRPFDHLAIVAGGIGQTPFLAVLKELQGQRRYGGRNRTSAPGHISFNWGVRSADLLSGLQEFESTGAEVRVATDDGSFGHHGLVTDLVEHAAASNRPPTALFGCGPEPMMAELAKIARSRRIPCWISLETKMACGYGVCFSCVCPVREDGDWDYSRVCLEGPVFDAETIHWPQMV